MADVTQDGKVNSPVNSLEGLIQDPVKSPLEDRIANLERDYKASSKEGHRLAEENRQLKEQAALADKYKKYEPFVNLLETDPKFVEHQMRYGQQSQPTFDTSGGGVGDPRFSAPPDARSDVRPINPKDYGLDTWDEYDEREAMANPNSPSGRLLLERQARISSAVVDAKVEQRLKERMSPLEKRLEAAELASRDEQIIRDFTTRNPKIPRNEVAEAFEWAKKTQLTPDQIVALYKMDKASKTMGDDGGNRSDLLAQLKRAAENPPTLAGRSSGGTVSNPDEDFFNLIKQAAPLRVG